MKAKAFGFIPCNVNGDELEVKNKFWKIVLEVVSYIYFGWLELRGAEEKDFEFPVMVKEKDWLKRRIEK